MKLFERDNIGSMEVKNRIAMAPMGTNGLTDIDCGYSRRLIDFYAARAKGGAGMIMTGAAITNTELEGGIAHFLPRMDSPAYMGRLSELCDAVHHYGSKLVLQLTAGFGRVNFVENNPIQPISASAVPCFMDPSTLTREITTEEIAQLIVSFATSAGMGMVAGVDAIEIQGYGGYLLDQFQTELWNQRTDEYGGDLDGRLRFSMEIIGATRAAVGPDLPIIYKFTPDHYIEGGRRVEEGLEMAKKFEAAGVAALHVDGGCYEVWNKVIPSMYEPAGCQIGLAKAVKEVVSVPVIAHGKLGNPALAAEVVEGGSADFIALGRPLLADPDWPNKVKAGKVDDVRPCISCNDACLGRGYEMKYLGCTVNPLCGMEKEYGITPIEHEKSVLVIGGGPGGLEAARVAASRGCKVSLWEKSERLGGKLSAASTPEFKQDIRPLIDYLAREAEKAGVKVELGKEATSELVRKAAPDVLIIATGSVLARPDVPGIDHPQVASSVDVLDGKTACGQTVVVVGAGLCGCEAAVHLAQQGKKVTLVEMAPDIVPESTNMNTMIGIHELIARSGVGVMTGTRLVEVSDTGAVVETDGSRAELSADTLVLASGFVRDTNLRDSVEDDITEVFTIGDCSRPSNILNAIWEGYHASRVI